MKIRPFAAEVFHTDGQRQLWWS